VVLTLTVYLFLLWSTIVKNGLSDYRRKLLAYPLGDVYVSHKHIGKQNPFIYTLFQRERRVVDIPTDHPSRSKKHAVIQFQ
jgi:smad nuclear-interacting protein 1